MRARTSVSKLLFQILRAGLVAFFFMGSLTDSWGQSGDTVVTPVDPKRLTVVVAGTGLAYMGSMIGLNQVWYGQYNRQSFQFFNDAAEWKQVDKLGHFYSAFHMASIGSRMLQWSHLPPRKSGPIAALAGFLMISSVEVFDGYSAGYGASATDLLANFCGTAFYLGQSLGWHEIRIQPKFSFHQTSLPKQNPNHLLGSGFGEELLKDYNGQTYWLSVDLDKFIRFPKWLNLCAGYGAGNMLYARDPQNESAGYAPFRKFYLGLDFDLTSIRTKSKVLKTLIYFVNMVRLPAPALEFSQGKLKGHFLYF